MIKDKKGLSPVAQMFFELLKEKAPDLLEIATIGSATEKYPYIEPGAIVIVIPARNNFPISEIYIETRKEDILISLVGLTHYHYSWYSEEIIQKYMLNAIQFINDILSEKRLFVKRRRLLSRKEYFEIVSVEELKNKKRVLAVFSWKGTLDTGIL